MARVCSETYSKKNRTAAVEKHWGYALGTETGAKACLVEDSKSSLARQKPLDQEEPPRAHPELETHVRGAPCHKDRCWTESNRNHCFCHFDITLISGLGKFGSKLSNSFHHLLSPSTHVLDTVSEDSTAEEGSSAQV